MSPAAKCYISSSCHNGGKEFTDAEEAVLIVHYKSFQVAVQPQSVAGALDYLYIIVKLKRSVRTKEKHMGILQVFLSMKFK